MSKKKKPIKEYEKQRNRETFFSVSLRRYQIIKPSMQTKKTAEKMAHIK